MKYSIVQRLLENNSNSQRRRALGLSDNQEAALDSLCSQYFHASQVNNLGDIGEAIALVCLGLSDSDDWRAAQESPYNTNKWSNRFPVVDVMTKPLDQRSKISDVQAAEYYSVKTGGATQNWTSLHKLVNFPTWARPTGIRDLLGRNPPRVLRLNIGLFHIARTRESDAVVITKHSPRSIEWEMQRENIISGCRARNLPTGRSNRLREFTTGNRFYSTQLPTGNARQFWTNIDWTITVPVQQNDQLARDLRQPCPTRRSLAMSPTVRGNRTRINVPGNWRRILNEIYELPNNEFYRAWAANSQTLEPLYNEMVRRWSNRMRDIPQRERVGRPLSLAQETRNPPA